MKNKIYVITSGCYSDYQIHAVFDSKELADKFIEKFNYFDEICAEEWDLNPLKKPLKKGYESFFVRMNIEGNVISVESKTSPFVKNKYGFDNRSNLYQYIMAKDKKHAIKITNENRLALIAQDMWNK